MLKLLADVAKLYQSDKPNAPLAQADIVPAAIFFVFSGNGSARADSGAICVSFRPAMAKFTELGIAEKNGFLDAPSLAAVFDATPPATH